MPLVLPDPTSPEYDTTDAAAHALANLFAQGGNNETAGLLYKTPSGKFVYSTSLPGTADHFELHAGVPKGHSIAGIVHTHPTDDPASQVFSQNDIDVAGQLKVPSYVRFLHDNSTRKYTPGVTKAERTAVSGSIAGQKTARGDDVPAPLPPAPASPAVAADPTTPPQAPPFAAFAASPQS